MVISAHTHSHLEWKKALRSLWASPGKSFAMVMYLRHWGLYMTVIVQATHIHSELHQLPILPRVEPKRPRGLALL